MIELKELEGKTLSEVYLVNDQEIVLNLNGMLYELSAIGGCCSHSYFQHISGVNCCGSEILSVEEMDTSDIRGLDGCDNKAYGYRFTTNKGYFEIDMRNDSNGYYGGYVRIERIKKVPFGIDPLKEDI